MDRKTQKSKLLELIEVNDIKIKNFLSETYPKGIPSKVLRNAREFGVYIDGELFNLRTGIDSKYTFDGIDVKLSGVTKYVETLDSNKIRSDVKIKYPSWARFERKKGSGLFPTDEALRKFKSTGVFKGKFIDNLINRQGDANKAIDELKYLRTNNDITAKEFDIGMREIFKKVNRYSGRRNVVGGELKYNPNNWQNYGTPIGKDGTLKTPENFIKEVNKSWKDQGILNKIIKTATGWEIHRGHGIASESFGPNIFNVAPQPALAITPGGTAGIDNLSANVQQGADTIKPIKQLESVGVSKNVASAFQEWSMDNTQGINRFTDLFLSDQSRLLHQIGLDVDQADIEGRQRILTERAKQLEGISSVFDKNSKTNHILQLIKKGSGKVKDITFGKTIKGTVTRGVGLLNLIDLLDPTQATELKAAEIVQGRTPLTKESAIDVGKLYAKDLKETGTTIAKTLPFITAGSQIGSMVAPVTTSTALGTLGPFSGLLGGVIAFDSLDNIFLDGKTKQILKKYEPGYHVEVGKEQTSLPGDFDYKNNTQGSYQGISIPSIK